MSFTHFYFYVLPPWPIPPWPIPSLAERSAVHRHRDAASRRFRGVDAPLREAKRSTSCCVARLIFFNFWWRGTILFACGARVEFYLLQCKKCQENVLRQLLAPTVSFWRVFQRIHSRRPRPPPAATPSKNGSLIISPLWSRVDPGVPGRPVHPHPHRLFGALLRLQHRGVAPEK